MGHYSSMNEHLKDLDIAQSESAKLYQQAKSDAAFLRSLSAKQESGIVVSVPFRSSSLGHNREYAFHRHRYLVMYSPFRTFGKKERNKSMKEKINKWFINNHNTKTTETNPNNDKTPSIPFLHTFFSFLWVSSLSQR
ncbi:hypothetical protein VNO77_01915 [Canavalia gladiata]|uniref:Uncharacterized protein n=1 Tax=Canavalia gladiata TaxID=3824 RepID=A0AAN9R5M8_CANGL